MIFNHFLMGFFRSKPRLIMIRNTNAIHIEMLCCLKPDQNNCFDMSCFFFPLAMTLIGGDRTMRIKNIFGDLLTKCEPRIPWLTVIGVLIWASWKRHRFAVQVLRVPLIACPSQPLNNNNAGTETLQNSPRLRNC